MLGDLIMFEKLTIENWRQFSKVDINFHPRLTVLAGVNGSGKTTVLNVLSYYMGWTPSTAYTRENSFDKGSSFKKNVIVNISPKRQIKGVFIQSHRPVFPRRKLKSIPTSVETRKEIFERYNDFSKKFINDEYRYLSEDDQKILSSTTLLKRDLAALALYGYGNAAVAPNTNARILFEGYCDLLKKALPKELGFKKIIISMPEVYFETDTGNFPIDSVSGGISSIIDITWRLFMFAEPNEPFVALIDEPENHLHPELQKSFLGNLMETFPNVQFIVATHNPLIISSQKDSHIYVLDYENNKVKSTLLDHVNLAGTSSAILRDVLGLDSTMPLWVDEKLNEIVEKFQKIGITSDSLNQLRAELTQLGMQDYVPNTMAKVIGGE